MRVSDKMSAAGGAASSIEAREIDAPSSTDTRGIDAKDVAAQKMATMKKRALLIEEDFSS
ncbi:MAG TPA: hypothetical protein VGQ76_20110 [Thermoanaerobaculia bacterium]|jgi:hypothetical protein|nr:hypothetical protein [Thermoanaerobaculia bacterium]